MPKREISNLEEAAEIISKAQHANPALTGQTDEERAQFINQSTVVSMILWLISSDNQLSGSAIGV